MEALGAAGTAAEGRFFPDTYAYARGVSDITVLRRAHRALESRLAQAWADRAPDSPLKSAEQALILASIVEKETGLPADRGLVAGVFVNRLRIGMPLQTDPTVIYGLGEAFDGNLRKRDLQTDTPYNLSLIHIWSSVARGQGAARNGCSRLSSAAALRMPKCACT